MNPEQCCTTNSFVICRIYTLTLLREKRTCIYLAGRYFSSKIRTTIPCWTYSLLFTGRTRSSFTRLLQFPQKLPLIFQNFFWGSAVLTLSSTEEIVLLFESCGRLVTSPVSLCFQEHSPAEEQLFQTTEVETRWLC